MKNIKKEVQNVLIYEFQDSLVPDSPKKEPSQIKKEPSLPEELGAEGDMLDPADKAQDVFEKKVYYQAYVSTLGEFLGLLKTKTSLDIMIDDAIESDFLKTPIQLSEGIYVLKDLIQLILNPIGCFYKREDSKIIIFPADHHLKGSHAPDSGGLEAELRGLALGYTRLGQHQLAIDTYYELIDRFPKSPRVNDVLIQIAKNHCFMGSIDEMNKLYEVMKNQHVNATVLKQIFGFLVETYLNREKYSDVIKLCLAKIELNQADPAGLTYYLGQAYSALGEPTKAITMFERFLSTAPNQEQSLVVIQAMNRIWQKEDRSLLALWNIEASLEYELVTDEEERGRAYRKLIEAYTDMRLFSQAKMVMGALQRDIRDSEVDTMVLLKLLGGEILHKGLPSIPPQDIEKFVRYSQERPFMSLPGDVKKALGQIYQFRGETPRALQVYQALLEDPAMTWGEQIELHMACGDIHKSQKTLESALRHYELAWVGAQDQEDTFLKKTLLLRMGEVSFDLNRFDKSISVYNLFLKIHPDSSLTRWILLQLARAHKEKGLLESAKEIYRQLRYENVPPLDGVENLVS
ncbi:tetratricopeptide repeat protein [PVC group bacterium]|nr:tetratricopeptide repeat protein [PVC group bacterium]